MNSGHFIGLNEGYYYQRGLPLTIQNLYPFDVMMAGNPKDLTYGQDNRTLMGSWNRDS